MARISSIPQEKATDSDDGQAWEDLPEYELICRSRPPSTTPSSSFRSTPSTGRIRRGATRSRTARKVPSPRKGDFRSSGRVPRERSPSIELLPPTPPEPISTRGPRGPEPCEILASSLGHVVCYVADVLFTVVRMMKTPICIVLVALACAYALAFASEAIRSALAPLCSFPLVSLACPVSQPSGPPRPPNPDRTPRWADFPSLLNVERKSFEALLDEAVEGPGLALEIKKAEMATSDLATLVRVSKLNSRDILADSLGEFVKDARKVGRGLTRFSSRVGGAVDNIIAVNDYALHAIESANSKPSALSLSRLWPFSPSEAATKQEVTRTFTEAMNTLSANMQRLVLEAEVSISDLNKLEEHLKSIHEVASREDSSISTARAELLAQLWTILGGNRDQLSGMDEHLALLKGVSGYRDRALAHVVAALHMLETMAEDMEELRERVAAPELVGDAIPIDVHMKSLRSGLERLKTRRTGAKELEEQFVKQVLGSGDGVKVSLD
ncbi:hypothetical protein BJV78DRAFT_814129 [Lactifluus subvellereus]|nr:hypothetical protein BJV78DRAFT_814129 [Lactifluus subvellereus]